ncbi:HAD family hydrolase [Persicirhabdus sediminis]|uniref:HAD family phosphatase n=1 Tax=Persicirhabdus sediminis TaxID=454144 RepID=A0A8J7SG31_9BACT|nr:HAD hydrolase family protein [Persicirhabdus sediminis]MBK1789855.1 HAD family phosphatase [Persicirhabdus sediminis]
MRNSLPQPGQARYLLSFDFDGTLHDPASNPAVEPAFFELIESLRSERGALWGINTGRSLFQMVQGFNEGKFPFLPDFVIAREREIFMPAGIGRWQPAKKWNRKCDRDHRWLFWRSRRLLKEMQRWVKENTEAEWAADKEEPAGVVASSHEEMDRIVEQIARQANRHPNLSYERNSIYLRFSHKHYNKGSSLAEVGGMLGVEAQNRFTIGDGHNDFGMMDLNVAGMLACPSNAAEEIKQVVDKLGGYTASQPASRGAIESLEHYFSS